MPDIDTLTVRIDADLGDLRRGLSEAEHLIGQGSDRMARSLGDVGRSQVTLAGAARSLGLTFASAFEDAVVEGRRLSDVLRGLEQDVLRILTRKLVTEPLAGTITGLIGGGTGVLAGLFHSGGRVGAASGSQRMVPAGLFDGAPRFAGGGAVGVVPGLAPGEVPAILHRGEIVRTPAQEAALRRGQANGGDVVFQPGAIVIQTPDAQGLAASRGQIEAMLVDAIRRGRRNR